VDTQLAQRAALLAKADLLTDMVGEFPELQGIMGSYYARLNGEHADVAQAMIEQYQPRFAGDGLPVTTVGSVLALADKLETLVGIWGIGLQPTGVSDPFGLRRHALGVLRILIEKQLPLTLSHLLERTVALFKHNPAFSDPSEALRDFIYDRLRGLLKDRGFSTAEVEAVVAPRPDSLADIVARLSAVQRFAALPEAAALASANKRITNILKKAEHVTSEVTLSLLQEPAERALYEATQQIASGVHNAYSNGDFTRALLSLATLRPQVDAFFDHVMVMADDVSLRANRIALLSHLHVLLNRVADISKLD
jgi:glycyl-tRNA synthetase beta chain